MKRKEHIGFSLIELMVVIAVILILVGLLIPVVGPMREKALAAKCASNLHQLQVGVMNYAGDNTAIPHAWSWQFNDPSNNTWAISDVGWVSWQRPVVTGNWNYYEWRGSNGISSITAGSLWKYTGDTKVYVCPTVQRLLAPRTNAVRSYGLNGYISGQSFYGLTDGSRRMLFTELPLCLDAQREFGARRPVAPNESLRSLERAFGGSDMWQDGNTYYWDLSHDGRFEGWTNNAGVFYEHIGAFHDGKGHCVFVDGHVEKVSYTNSMSVGDGTWLRIDGY